MQQFRLISMSAVLSTLIWVVADQSLTSTTTLSVSLAPFPGGGSDMVVSLPSQHSQLFDVQVTGKKGAISSLKAREPLAIRLPVASRDPGDYKLRVLDELRNLTNGDLDEVLVQAVDPPTLAVRIDRDLTVTMPVQVLRGALDYDVPPVVEPTEVSVTISELAYRGLAEEQKRIVLDPDEYLRTAPRGVLHTTPVPLTALVADISVQLEPDMVNLRFKLAQHLEEKTISAVPIKIESSLEIFNAYEVEIRGAGAVLTQPVTIRGPSALIERIDTAAEVGFWGTISLTAADKADPGRYRYRTPRFNLPEGVEIVGTVEPIEFRLVLRDSEPKESP